MKKVIFLLVVILFGMYAYTLPAPGHFFATETASLSSLEYFISGLLLGGIPPTGQCSIPFIVHANSLGLSQATNTHHQLFSFLMGEFVGTVGWLKLSQFLTTYNFTNKGFKTYMVSTAPWLLTLLATWYKYPRVIKPITLS